jgi:hypothetical protein
MRIDQRNAGASVTPTADGTYTLDRFYVSINTASKFSVQQNAGSVTPPAGFTKYLGITSLSAYSIPVGEVYTLQQPIEGFNTSDLNWGTASASAVTLSFEVFSSLTGTFGGVLKNSAQDRAYPFSYTISAANTWEQKSITIPGDTTGTWLKTNGIGINVVFGLGCGSTYSATAGAWTAGNYYSATGATSVVGTNGATFYITGVQLEKGSTATSFDYRPYGTELALCQRYYYKTVNGASFQILTGAGHVLTTSTAQLNNKFPVSMRIAPTALEQSGTATDYTVYTTTNTTCTSVPLFSLSNTECAVTTFTTGATLVAGQGCQGRGSSGIANAYLGWSAEL